MVYHYTTIETFYNMLVTYKSSEDKEYLEFWASNALNQNDSTELSLGVDDLLPIIRDIEKNSDLTDLRKLSEYNDFDWTPYLIGQMPRNIDESFRTLKYAPFTVSFSKEMDMLLMWAMYANNGNGICMSFDETKLKCSQSDLWPVADSVFYEKNPKLYFEIVKELYKMYYKEIENIYTRQGTHHVKQKHLVGMLAAISPFIKDKAFEKEAEYRIVFYKVSDESPIVYTRLTSRLNVINYVKVKIPLDALQNIIVGPCADYNGTRALLVDNMKSCGIVRDYDKGFIQKSKVPYRWY